MMTSVWGPSMWHYLHTMSFNYPIHPTEQDKKYYKHTGYPGGIKVTTPEKLYQKKPEETLKLAVKRMLPGGVLGRKQLTKLKIYSGNNHPHSAQNLQVIDLDKLNSKNISRN